MVNQTEDHSDSYDIVFLGNYTKDTIITSTSTRYVDGGGFNYGAHAAAMMGLKVAAVTRLAKEDYRVVETLIRLGVDVFPQLTPRSTHMKLYYPSSNVDDRVLSITSKAGSFVPGQVEGLSAKAFVITGSSRGEFPVEIIEKLRNRGALLVADAQTFLRTIAADGTLVLEEWPEKRQVLSLIDVLKTDAVEAEFLTGEANRDTAARTLAQMGPREVLLTHQEGVLVYADDQFHRAPFYPKKLAGRSGRGDTCIAAYVSKRLTTTPQEATIWAAAVTSLKMEAEGPIVRKMSDAYDLIRAKYRDL